jgi:tetratricopeptide (TPR) repeat protein
MLRALTLLVVFACAAPVWAVKVKLKAEEKDFEAAIVSLEDGEVLYRKGRKDFTARLEDFELESQFLIKDELAGETGDELLDLARFALHRGLYAQAQKTAAQAAKLAGFADQAARLSTVAFNLEADAVLDKAIVALDEKDTAKARPLLEEVTSRFPTTPAAVKADILLGTLKRVELEVRAAALEKEAQKAQQDADAEEQKRREPIDTWLTELEGQVSTNADIKKEADEDCLEGATNRGLPKYENVVEAMQTVRNSIAKNRALLKYRGQDEHGNRIDDKARQLIIECYYRWAYYLYVAARYDVAVAVCKRGIAMDPKDRRFLSLKVDIDEVYDPKDE